MLKANQLKFLELAVERFGKNAVVSRNELVDLADMNGIQGNDLWWMIKPEYHASRGFYRIPDLGSQKQTAPVVTENRAAMAADIIPMRKDTPVATKKFDPNAVSEHDYAAVPAKEIGRAHV